MIIPPSNIILSNQYTSGNEYIYAESRQPYQGYYYELNSKFFVGKTFNSSSPELIKVNSAAATNPLKSNPSSSLYSDSYGKNLPNDNITSINLAEEISGVKYVAKKTNSNKIFFISEEDYNNNQNNSLYILAQLPYDSEFGFFLSEENSKKMPGLKDLVEEYSNRDDTDY